MMELTMVGSVKTLLKGLVVGWIVTQGVDRGKRAAYEAAARKFAARLGISLSRRDARILGLTIQQVLTVGSGLLYATLSSRRRAPTTVRRRARSKAA